MMISESYLIFLLVLFHPLAIGAWNNLGTEFLLAFGPNNVRWAHPERTRVMLAVREACSVSVEIPLLNNTTTYHLSANTYKYLEYSGNSLKFSETPGIERKCIRIRSTKPIAVFGFNHAQYSVDGFLAYPITTQNASYISVSYQGNNATGTSYTFLLVTTFTPNTQVSVKLRLGSKTSLSFKGSNYTSGSWINVTLQAADVLGLMTDIDDLTGSQIFANNAVSVYSGTDCAVIDGAAGDHAVTAIPPAATFGREFITGPIFPSLRRAGDKFRIIALQSHTNISSTQGSYFLSNIGDFQDVLRGSSEYDHFKANNPFMLVQFSRSRKIDNSNIDPFMMMIPSVKQFDSSYIFTTPSTTSETFDNVLTVVSHTAFKNDIILDGVPISTSWNTINCSSFVVASISLPDGLHQLWNSNPNVSFGANVCGTALHTSTKIASYGYPAGMSFTPITQQCQNTTGCPSDNIDNDCDGTIDEECSDGIDNDGDGLVDEDISATKKCTVPHATTAATTPQGTASTERRNKTSPKARTVTTLATHNITTVTTRKALKPTTDTGRTTHTPAILTTKHTLTADQLTTHLTTRTSMEAMTQQNRKIMLITRAAVTATIQPPQQPSDQTSKHTNAMTSTGFTRLHAGGKAMSTNRLKPQSTPITISIQANKIAAGPTEHSQDGIPKLNSVYPMVAGVTGITLAVSLVCLICVLDARTMLQSLRFGLGNVRHCCARRCCRRRRRKKKNAVNATND